MKRNHLTAFILAAAVFAAPLPMLQAGNVHAGTVTEEDEKASVGLIEKCTLSCYSRNGTIFITFKTQLSGVMDEAGCINIVVQRSSDMKEWEDEFTIDDMITENTRHFAVSGHQEKVDGDFYYRVVCEHYAKGVPFNGTLTLVQTAENTSNVVRISKPKEPIRHDDLDDIIAPAEFSRTMTTTTSTTITTSTKSTSYSTASQAAETTKTAAGGSVRTADSPKTGVRYPIAEFFTALAAGITAVRTRNNKRRK